MMMFEGDGYESSEEQWPGTIVNVNEQQPQEEQVPAVPALLSDDSARSDLVSRLPLLSDVGLTDRIPGLYAAGRLLPE